jgi:hypothetical protein
MSNSKETAIDCSACSHCLFKTWVENEIKELSEENFKQGLFFSISKDTWDRLHFTIKRVKELIKQIKYKVLYIHIFYKEECKAYKVSICFP